MPIDPKDLAILQAFLDKRTPAPGFAPDEHCPSCGTNKWIAEGPLAMMPIVPGMGVAISGTVVPVVVLVCENCYFIRQYAWAPIKNAAEGG